VSTKSYKEVKDLSKDELVTKIREVELSLFQTKMKHSTGQLENTGTLWKQRKALAMMKGLLTTRNLEVSLVKDNAGTKEK